MLSASNREPTSIFQKYRRTKVEYEGPKAQSPVTFLAPILECLILAIPLTKTHFLDAYSKGKWNLSCVPCPPCFEEIGYLPAPECYNEASRRKPVEKYLKLQHWQDKTLFKTIIGNLRKSFNVVGVLISIIDKNKTYVKVETLKDMEEIPRGVSLDAHTMLSQGHLLILDASKDWRTGQNPFVNGVPHIRFYCGVPLLAKNEVIGVLAIFDSSSKSEFLDENCKKLRATAKQVMALLDTPFEAFKSSTSDNPKVSELNNLRMKLGRATSTNSTLKTVYEKDGSGGPYCQNHNFRYTHLLHEDRLQTPHLDNKMLWDKMCRIGSLKNSAMSLCKAIASTYKVDLVYILEISVAEPYRINAEYFPTQELKIETENYRYANKIEKLANCENEYMSRIIGIYGSNYSSLNFENEIHYKAISSEFGVEYKNPHDNALYNRGIIMPFFRHKCQLIRRSKEKKKVLDVYLRSGAYLVALLNEESNNDVNLNTISNIYTNTSVLRKIFLSPSQ